VPEMGNLLWGALRKGHVKTQEDGLSSRNLCNWMSWSNKSWTKFNRSSGVKRQGREADHSPPFSAEVKNTWSYTSTPPYAFAVWCLVEHSPVDELYQEERSNVQFNPHLKSQNAVYSNMFWDARNYWSYLI
jgi:hypothetical protein